MTGSEVVLSDMAALDTLAPAAREVALTGILTQSRDWLIRATRATDPARAISDFKAFISTVAEAAKQKKVSEEIVTEATVMVRRTERALGVAIREGQERGEISSRSMAASVTARNREAHKRGEHGNDEVIPVPSPSEYLNSGAETVHIHVMADVSPVQFEEALTEAQEEGNVSRANVVRKLRNEPEPVKTRKTNPIIERTVLGLSGYRMGLQTITAIDPGTDNEQANAWINEISDTIRELSRVRKLLKEANQ